MTSVSLFLSFILLFLPGVAPGGWQGGQPHFQKKEKREREGEKGNQEKKEKIRKSKQL